MRWLRRKADPMTSNYVRVTELAGLFTEARELSVRTMIFDVEPLVAPGAVPAVGPPAGAAATA
jgi:hypothetical protein